MTEDDIFAASRKQREDWDMMPALEEDNCRTCLEGGIRPPHMPSRLCDNNGTNAHCTCARCWGR